MTFHSLSPLLFSQFMRFSQKGEAFTTTGSTTLNSWSLQVLCIRSVVLLGKGESRGVRGLLPLMLRLAQVSVAAVSRIRWFVFGVRMSSAGPAGVD